MARQLRADFDGALHHVYHRGLVGRVILRSNADRLLFLEWLGNMVVKFGWIVHAYTLMTNHFHLLIERPKGGLSRGMQEILTNYVQTFNPKRRRKGGLFQGRFKSHLVEKESYLLELARYIVLNPVRAKMVERPVGLPLVELPGHLGARSFAFLADDLVAARPVLLLASSLPRLRRCGSRPRALALGRSSASDLPGQHAMLERMRGWVESEELSVEIPRRQRCIARPSVETVIGTVAEVMEIDAADLVEQRGGLARTLVAHLAFHEGLVRLREIARSLTLRSSGHISNLVRRAADEIKQHRDVAAIAEQCLARLRPATLSPV